MALIEIPPYGKVQGASTLKRTFRFGKLPAVASGSSKRQLRQSFMTELCVKYALAMKMCSSAAS